MCITNSFKTSLMLVCFGSAGVLFSVARPEPEVKQESEARPKIPEMARVSLLIGIGFAAGAKEGILLTIALTIELLFLSLSVSATLSQDNASRRRVITTTLGIALLLPLGAAVGVTLLGGFLVPPWLLSWHLG
jgi:hypothetical protein